MRWLVAAVAGVGFAGGRPAASETPPINYMLQCQGCHLADGSGSPMGVPALLDTVGKFLRVPRGREYLVRVPGSAQAPISDSELAQLLNWIIRRFGPREIAADFLPFAQSEVARYRDRPLTDVVAMRAELVAQIEGMETSRQAEAMPRAAAGPVPDP